jgi:hypothetical protein
MELMDFAAKVAEAIRDQRGHVTKLIVEEADEDSGYPNCYHIRVEDGVRWAEYWVSRTVLGDREWPADRTIMHTVEALLYRLKHGDPITMHRPARLSRQEGSP